MCRIPFIYSKQEIFSNGGGGGDIENDKFAIAIPVSGDPLCVGEVSVLC